MTSLSNDRTGRKAGARLEAARRCVERGFSVIPVCARSKRPAVEDWPSLHLNEADLAHHFGEDINIGVLNGQPSGGLVDVDLDAFEALAVADAFLPATDLVFGRASKPRSHREYIADPLPDTVQFKDIDNTMLIELRSTGTQTVWPPSKHPDGEKIAFDAAGEPAVIVGATLRAAVARVAACALLARHWPRVNGSRHDIALAAAGHLLRAGLDKDAVRKIVYSAAEVAGDEEAKARIMDVNTTAKALAAGKPVTGGPTLAALVGGEVVQRLSDWLGFHPHAGGNSASSAYSAGAQAGPWGPPIPLDTLDVLPFPLDALSPVLRDWVVEVAATCKVPLDLPGLLALGVVGAAAARRFEVLIGATHRVPLNLYVAAVARSGERKGPALRAMLAPLQAIERECRRAASHWQL